ncbi:13402_t:CDS:2, partial [Dentiscutata erythropus]
DIRFTKLTKFGKITINLKRGYEKSYYKVNKDGRLHSLNDNPLTEIFDDAIRLTFTPSKGVSVMLC